MLEIDGAYREGGGQIVRTALALSACTGKPFRAVRIRAGRKQPGLKAQHVTGARAIQQLCRAHVEGATVGSETLVCEPGPLTGTHVEADIGTAGSITLLLQCLMLPLLHVTQPVTLRLIGGTDVAWAPPWDAFATTILPFTPCAFELKRRGFHPAGGGEVRATVRPTQPLEPISLLHRGRLLSLQGRSVAAASLAAREVAERQARAAKADVEVVYAPAYSPGSVITLWARFESGVVIGANALGAKRLPAERVGEMAAQEMQARLKSEACVDEHAADQLIPFLALAGGEMRVERISEHCYANIYVAEQFLDVRFETDEAANIIRCRKSR